MRQLQITGHVRQGATRCHVPGGFIRTGISAKPRVVFDTAVTATKSIEHPRIGCSGRRRLCAFARNQAAGDGNAPRRAQPGTALGRYMSGSSRAASSMWPAGSSRCQVPSSGDHSRARDRSRSIANTCGRRARSAWRPWSRAWPSDSVLTISNASRSSWRPPVTGSSASELLARRAGHRFARPAPPAANGFSLTAGRPSGTARRPSRRSRPLRASGRAVQDPAR
jgi:hypothetical protein